MSIQFLQRSVGEEYTIHCENTTTDVLQCWVLQHPYLTSYKYKKLDILLSMKQELYFWSDNFL